MTADTSIFAEVVVDKYVDMAFDYIVPKEAGNPSIGAFVKIPFQGKVNIGCITSLKSRSEVPPDKLKPVYEIMRSIPPLGRGLLELSRWISSYYGCPLGMVVRSAVPSFVFKNRRDKDYLPKDEKPKLTPPYQLNDDQNKALSSIAGSIEQSDKKVFLLWGVTGSGKTEVYMHSIARALLKGKSALVIVPEIALTPQLVGAFRKRFTEPVAVFHSRLTEAERAYYWRMTAEGKIRIALGARSAIFAPLKNLGLIVVDEEHERTYKQEEAPRYNARDIAIVRGMLESATVVLGSATPSLESFTNCKTGKYELLKLPSRVSSKPLPKISLIDMEQENTTRKGIFLFSGKLVQMIHERIQRKEQTILFLNRRGFTTCHVCGHCHHVVRCPQCSIAMTYHREGNLLVCHRCDREEKPVRTCPECREATLKAMGFGTEKVEKQVKAVFPLARVARLDSDTVKKKGTLESVCSDFSEGKIDILIGTQMIAKGLHFEGVTLVGVVSGDLSLNIPDFRAGETSFQLFTQVAGRAGRGNIPGEVVIQTHCTNHPIFRHAMNSDYLAFYDFESSIRKDLNYPPYSHFVLITCSDPDEVKAAKTANEIWSCLKSDPGFKPLRLFPVVPSPVSKIRTKYRYQLLFSSRRIKHDVKLAGEILSRSFPSKMRDICIDVDPYSML